MKARPQPVKNFSGGQIGVDERTSKKEKVDFDCIMKAFFDELK